MGQNDQLEWYDWYPEKGERGTFKVAELYDVINDPTETVNLAFGTNHKVVMKELSIQLDKGWRNALPKNSE